MSSPLPPPEYPAIALIVLFTVWLEGSTPKRRKAFFARLRRAIERHNAGERPLRLDRPLSEGDASEAEVQKAFVYLEAWAAKVGPFLTD